MGMGGPGDMAAQDAYNAEAASLADVKKRRKE